VQLVGFYYKKNVPILFAMFLPSRPQEITKKSPYHISGAKYRFVVSKVTLWRVFLRVLQSSPYKPHSISTPPSFMHRPWTGDSLHAARTEFLFTTKNEPLKSLKTIFTKFEN